MKRLPEKKIKIKNLHTCAMATPFEQAWFILKMPPYYHGTSSAYLPSIREKGLQPSSHEESHWSQTENVDYGTTNPKGPQKWVFVTDSPDSAKAYSGIYGSPDAPEGVDSESFAHPHKPIVLEIPDDVEDMEGFERGPYGDYRLPIAIPPEMLSLIYQGPNYLQWDNNADEDEEVRRHWKRYHEQMDTPWMEEFEELNKN